MILLSAVNAMPGTIPSKNIVYSSLKSSRGGDMVPISTVYIKEENMLEDMDQEESVSVPVLNRQKAEVQQKNLCDVTMVKKVQQVGKIILVPYDVCNFSIPNEARDSTIPIVSQSPYTCAMCLQYFSTMDLLISHVFSHALCVSSPLHICKYCGLVFLNLSKLFSHNCQETKKVVFKEPSLIELGCAFCGDTFLSWCSLTKHVFSHISTISTPFYVSKYYSEVFEDLDELHLYKYSNCTSHRRHCHRKSNIYNKKLVTGKITKEEEVTSYSSSENLRIEQGHKRNQSKEQSIMCNICDKPFSVPIDLNNQYCINSCQCSFQSKAYQQSTLHSDKLEVCLKSFDHSKNLEVYQIILPGERPLSSEVCGKSFPLPVNLESHQRIHARDRRWCCQICGKSFTGFGDLKNHHKIHSREHPFSCDVCGKIYKQSSSLHIHKRIHSGLLPYYCQVCGTSFKLSQDLKRHHTIHSGERPYSCQVCLKSFKSSVELKAHHRIHSGERPFACEDCGKSFTQYSNLYTHQKIHSAERPYSCQICRKSFKLSKTLKQHEMIHSGEFPFSCDICGKPFRLAANLVYHQRIHSGERPYSCQVCGKSFMGSGDLKKHHRIHSGERPFSCEACGKSFTQKGSLHIHQRIHSEERPYSCQVCGKCFKGSDDLKRHVRIHSNERPFSCKVCGKTYKYNGVLKTHQILHCRDC